MLRFAAIPVCFVVMIFASLTSIWFWGALLTLLAILATEIRTLRHTR